MGTTVSDVQYGVYTTVPGVQYLVYSCTVPEVLTVPGVEVGGVVCRVEGSIATAAELSDHGVAAPCLCSVVPACQASLITDRCCATVHQVMDTRYCIDVHQVLYTFTPGTVDLHTRYCTPAHQVMHTRYWIHVRQVLYTFIPGTVHLYTRFCTPIHQVLYTCIILPHFQNLA